MTDNAWVKFMFPHLEELRESFVAQYGEALEITASFWSQDERGFPHHLVLLSDLVRREGSLPFYKKLQELSGNIPDYIEARDREMFWHRQYPGGI